MVDLEELRYLALSFPDTSEEEHHDRPAFRVGGKIFATLPDDEHINVLLDAEAAHIATVITPSGSYTLIEHANYQGVHGYSNQSGLSYNFVGAASSNSHGWAGSGPATRPLTTWPAR